MDKPLVVVPRTMLRSFAARQLKVEQGGLCPLCISEISLATKGEGVVDHNHDTGEIRGILHRSCNAAEGKIANAAARWGCKSNKYEDIIPYLERVVEYLKKEGTGRMYPMHKTPDEKKTARNAKVKAQRAAAKAKVALRSRREI